MKHLKKENTSKFAGLFILLMFCLVTPVLAFTYSYEDMSGTLAESHCHASTVRQPYKVSATMIDCEEWGNGPDSELYVYIQEGGDDIFTGWLGPDEWTGTISCSGGNVQVSLYNVYRSL